MTDIIESITYFRERADRMEQTIILQKGTEVHYTQVMLQDWDRVIVAFKHLVTPRHPPQVLAAPLPVKVLARVIDQLQCLCRMIWDNRIHFLPVADAEVWSRIGHEYLSLTWYLRTRLLERMPEDTILDDDPYESPFGLRLWLLNSTTPKFTRWLNLAADADAYTTEGYIGVHGLQTTISEVGANRVAAIVSTHLRSKPPSCGDELILCLNLLHYAHTESEKDVPIPSVPRPCLDKGQRELIVSIATAMKTIALPVAEALLQSPEEVDSYRWQESVALEYGAAHIVRMLFRFDSGEPRPLLLNLCHSKSLLSTLALVLILHSCYAESLPRRLCWIPWGAIRLLKCIMICSGINGPSFCVGDQIPSGRQCQTIYKQTVQSLLVLNSVWQNVDAALTSSKAGSEFKDPITSAWKLLGIVFNVPGSELGPQLDPQLLLVPSPIVR